MASPTSNLLLSILMFATGVGIPVMAVLNGRLGGQLGSPWAASFLLFILAAVVSVVAVAVLGAPQHGWFVASPVYYAGGLLVAFYVLSITCCAPRIGVANAVFFVLAGTYFARRVA